MNALVDNTGAPVTVRLDTGHPISSYTVRVADEAPVGRTDFLDSAETGEWIVFHTEVGREFGGRGLAGLLVREVLADSLRQNVTVVPVCPLFARHLSRHGDEFVADGGTFREPTAADVALVAHATRNGE